MLNIRKFRLKASLSLFLVKNAYYAFFHATKGMLNEMLSRFELFLNTVVRIRRKEKVMFQNAPHRTSK